jgi:selenide,water dikinase
MTVLNCLLGDDAALIIPPASPAYSVHTIDYFRSFVSDPYVFGQIAANHALSDVYAMNGDPVSALALAVVPFGPERMVSRDAWD